MLFVPTNMPKLCLLVLTIVVLTSGCAGAPAPYRTPDHWQKTGYVWPPAEGHASSFTPAPASNSTWSNRRPESQSADADPTWVRGHAFDLDPAFGAACQRKLRSLGVRFRKLRSLKGVENPVEIIGKLGSIELYATDGRTLQMDCRLAVTLAELSPIFSELGVTRIRYSGAYSYRTTRSGRLSHHAHGLAIDLHDFEFGGEKLSVKHDFKTGMKCRRSAPRLNRLACALESTAAFRELLTPDYNRDHRDHLHLAVPRRDQL